MTSIKLRYVQAFTARGRRFYYFRKPGSARIRLPGLPGSDEFMAAYQAALADSPCIEIGASRTMPGTVDAAIVAYYASAHFNDLSTAAQRFRRNVIEAFRAERGDRPVRLLASHHIVAMLERITKPHARKNWLKAIRPMLQHAQKIGLIAVDPTFGIKTKLPKSDGFKVWEELQIARFRAEHALGSMERLALELLLNTVQRRGDVIHMGRQHIRNVMVDGVPTPMIYLRQRKTGAEMDIPVMPELAAAIDANHGSHLTFLTDNGEPFDDGKFGRWFRSACDAAGLQGFSAHGLRKAGCTTLADHGCTTHEIQAWSGHKSLSEIERYVAKANQVKLVMSGAAKLATSSVKHPPPKLSNKRQQVEKKGK